jgi:hypothetical protein
VEAIKLSLIDNFFKPAVHWSNLLLIYRTMIIQRMKYELHETFVKHPIIVDEHTKSCWRYHHYPITPYLREPGIQRTDPVLCLPDGSPNITLYMIDQGISIMNYCGKAAPAI